MRKTVIVSFALMIVALASVAAANVDSFFDIHTEIHVAGPPYPACCQEGPLGHEAADGTIVVDGTLSVSLAMASDLNTGQPLVARLDSLPPRTWSVDSFFDIDYGDRKQFVVDSFFDIHYEYGSSYGVSPTFVPDVPGSYNVDSFFDIEYFDSFFDIEYRVAFGPDAHHVFHLHGVVADGLRIESLTIPQGDFTVDSFFDIWVEIRVDSPPNEEQPPLHMVMTGSFFEGPVADESATWSAVKSIYRD